jgi:hypothetical protein
MRAGAPIPVVQRAEPAGSVPPFARAFDPSNDLVSGWILPLCDPELPEKPTVIPDLQ